MIILPIGDRPNPPNFTPWVNYGLIGLNIFIHLCLDPSVLDMAGGLEAYEVFVREHAYRTGSPEVTDLLTSMFLHAGWMHLAGNMLFLWIYGDNVEHRLGRLGYLLVYLGSGIGATLIYGLLTGPSMVPLLGASGAISGVLGLYFLLFPRNRVKLFAWVFVFVRVFELPARWVLGFYVVMENLLPLWIGGATHVAYGAHLGGFIAGFAIALVGERHGWMWPWKEARAPRPTAGPNEPEAAWDVLREALREGRLDDAVTACHRIGRRVVDQLSPAETVLVVERMSEQGYPIASIQMLRRAIGVHVGSPDHEQARLQLALARMRLRQGQGTAAYEPLLQAAELASEGSDIAMQANLELDRLQGTLH
jgi:membrane associated rhomboid family serine protease